MPARLDESAKKGPQRSRKGPAEIGAEKKHRGQAKSDRDRQAQYERERPDRRGPQGGKDKDFQRKH
jgi:hypothetical protein